MAAPDPTNSATAQDYLDTEATLRRIQAAASNNEGQATVQYLLLEVEQALKEIERQKGELALINRAATRVPADLDTHLMTAEADWAEAYQWLESSVDDLDSAIEDTKQVMGNAGLDSARLSDVFLAFEPRLTRLGLAQASYELAVETGYDMLRKTTIAAQAKVEMLTKVADEAERKLRDATANRDAGGAQVPAASTTEITKLKGELRRLRSGRVEGPRSEMLEALAKRREVNRAAIADLSRGVKITEDQIKSSVDAITQDAECAGEDVILTEGWYGTHGWTLRNEYHVGEHDAALETIANVVVSGGVVSLARNIEFERTQLAVDNEFRYLEGQLVELQDSWEVYSAANPNCAAKAPLLDQQLQSLANAIHLLIDTTRVWRDDCDQTFNIYASTSNKVLLARKEASDKRAQDAEANLQQQKSASKAEKHDLHVQIAGLRTRIADHEADLAEARKAAAAEAAARCNEEKKALESRIREIEAEHGDSIDPDLHRRLENELDHLRSQLLDNNNINAATTSSNGKSAANGISPGVLADIVEKLANASSIFPLAQNLSDVIAVFEDYLKSNGASGIMLRGASSLNPLCDIDLAEFMRLYDTNIANANILQDRIDQLENLGSLAPTTSQRRSDSLSLGSQLQQDSDLLSPTTSSRRSSDSLSLRTQLQQQSATNQMIQSALDQANQMVVDVQAQNAFLNITNTRLTHELAECRSAQPTGPREFDTEQLLEARQALQAQLDSAKTSRRGLGEDLRHCREAQPVPGNDLQELESEEYCLQAEVKRLKNLDYILELDPADQASDLQLQSLNREVVKLTRQLQACKDSQDDPAYNPEDMERERARLQGELDIALAQVHDIAHRGSINVGLAAQLLELTEAHREILKENSQLQADIHELARRVSDLHEAEPDDDDQLSDAAKIADLKRFIRNSNRSPEMCKKKAALDPDTELVRLKTKSLGQDITLGILERRYADLLDRYNQRGDQSVDDLQAQIVRLQAQVDAAGNVYQVDDLQAQLTQAFALYNDADAQRQAAIAAEQAANINIGKLNYEVLRLTGERDRLQAQMPRLQAIDDTGSLLEEYERRTQDAEDDEIERRDRQIAQLTRDWNEYTGGEGAGRGELEQRLIRAVRERNEATAERNAMMAARNAALRSADSATLRGDRLEAEIARLGQELTSAQAVAPDPAVDVACLRKQLEDTKSAFESSESQLSSVVLLLANANRDRDRARSERDVANAAIAADDDTQPDFAALNERVRQLHLNLDVLLQTTLHSEAVARQYQADLREHHRQEVADIQHQLTKTQAMLDAARISHEAARVSDATEITKLRNSMRDAQTRIAELQIRPNAAAEPGDAPESDRIASLKLELTGERDMVFALNTRVNELEDQTMDMSINAESEELRRQIAEREMEIERLILDPHLDQEELTRLKADNQTLRRQLQKCNDDKRDLKDASDELNRLNALIDVLCRGRYRPDSADLRVGGDDAGDGPCDRCGSVPGLPEDTVQRYHRSEIEHQRKRIERLNNLVNETRRSDSASAHALEEMVREVNDIRREHLRNSDNAKDTTGKLRTQIKFLIAQLRRRPSESDNARLFQMVNSLNAQIDEKNARLKDCEETKCKLLCYERRVHYLSSLLDESTLETASLEMPEDQQQDNYHAQLLEARAEIEELRTERDSVDFYHAELESHLVNLQNVRGELEEAHATIEVGQAVEAELVVCLAALSEKKKEVQKLKAQNTRLQKQKDNGTPRGSLPDDENTAEIVSLVEEVASLKALRHKDKATNATKAKNLRDQIRDLEKTIKQIAGRYKDLFDEDLIAILRKQRHNKNDNARLASLADAALELRESFNNGHPPADIDSGEAQEDDLDDGSWSIDRASELEQQVTELEAANEDLVARLATAKEDRSSEIAELKLKIAELEDYVKDLKVKILDDVMKYADDAKRQPVHFSPIGNKFPAVKPSPRKKPKKAKDAHIVVGDSPEPGSSSNVMVLIEKGRASPRSKATPKATRARTPAPKELTHRVTKNKSPKATSPRQASPRKLRGRPSLASKTSKAGGAKDDEEESAADDSSGSVQPRRSKRKAPTESKASQKKRKTTK
ncbi:uncharacterized protein L3040_000899 [Drepanopeziza brunnea f. sp. 'multigermtubi']|uniref:uncharacterized protein n=1 Tax=Drepanopeziza brunnea f. sp. 'multigermtubi' TaxID=698441 RepID=UPI0023845552|nr:hypothetical protein L3040_000899 [Drepanopeziza brunnea f. sp. 'multigermtubi']